MMFRDLLKLALPPDGSEVHASSSVGETLDTARWEVLNRDSASLALVPQSIFARLSTSGVVSLRRGERLQMFSCFKMFSCFNGPP